MSFSITQFNHLRTPLDEIQKATNNFSEENKIGKDDFGYIYEGQLLRSGEKINVSAKRLDRSKGQGDVEFWTEISVLSGLKHPNIVSLIGFCDEKGEKIIINSHEAKGSLGMYLSDPALTWFQRLRISFGVAKAIRYIHYEEGRNYSIIHRNINSSTILLDDNFEAKLSGFEFSIKDSVDRMERYVPLEVIHTQGYTDPETIKSGDVTQKSDIYSFGVVLCEIMCGRKAFLPNEQGSNRFLDSLARFHLRNDTLQDIINPGIFNQMAQDSYKLFVHVIRSSIGEDRKEHRDMNVNLYVLKEALDRQVPSLNPVPSLNQNPVPTYTRVDDATFPSPGVNKDENEALCSLNPRVLDDATFPSFGVKIDENEALRSLNPRVLDDATFPSFGVKIDENEALRSLNPSIAETFASRGVKKDENEALYQQRVLDDATFPSFGVKIDENEALRSLNPSMAETFASRGYKKYENEALYRQVRSLNPSIAETFASRDVKKDENEALYRQVYSLNTRAKTFPSFGVKKDENDALQPPSRDELGVVVESKPNKPRKVNKLEHLRIGFRDIQLATDNFSKKSAILLEDPVDIYKGDLKWFDRKYVSSLKGKNIGELPKRRYNVRIMCFKDAAGVDMFYREIEIISTCKHDNIDSLLGFCDEGSHMILVFEGNNCNLMLYLGKQVLTWDICLKICLDVAHGLKYIHNEMEDQKMVIHRQLNSVCIWLDDDWQGAKISGFGLATFRENEVEEIFRLHKDDRFMAPEFIETCKATKESDIYSFGLIMFEILSGLSIIILRKSNVEFRAEHWFKEGKIKQRVAPVLREENRGNKLFLKEGPNEDSLDTFIKITEQCLAVNPKHRPTLQVIIEQLEKALLFQINHKDHLRMSYKDIEAATQSFSCANNIGSGGFGRVYKGKLASEHGSSTIVAKRLDASQGQGDQQFKNELHILSEYKHENVIGLVGYNNDEQERIIVYEYASKGSLDKYLNDASLTWINRLKICVDVVRGLAFLHGGVREHEAVIHRDMKTANILLFDDWKAKVADFGLSLICTISDETDYVIDYASGTPGYLDPIYQKSRFLTKESDIYSLGVILFEILYGKSTYEIKKRENQFLHSLVKQRFEEGRLDEVVFNAIKIQIVPEALATFQAIAYQCLHDDREKRPTAQHVLVQLQKALELQVKGVPGLQES